MSGDTIDVVAHFIEAIKASIPSEKACHLDDAQVQRIVKAAAARVGITGHVSSHWLRHSHASHSLDREASLVTVRDILGHTSIATTNKYLHSKCKDLCALHLAV